MLSPGKYDPDAHNRFIEKRDIYYNLATDLGYIIADAESLHDPDIDIDLLKDIIRHAQSRAEDYDRAVEKLNRMEDHLNRYAI